VSGERESTDRESLRRDEQDRSRARCRAGSVEAVRQIAAWWYERFTFKLADDCRYTPDFVIQDLDGSLRAEETKGFWRDDAKVKVRVFATMFPIPIRALLLKKGVWTEEKF
jgi:hypothetical protein